MRAAPRVLLLLGLLALLAAPAASDLEGLDEAEPVVPASNLQPTPPPSPASTPSRSAPRPATQPTAPVAPEGPLPSSPFLILLSVIGKFEIGVLVFLFLFTVNYWWGRGTNANLAAAFCKAFCLSDSLLERNFSLVSLGPGGQELMRDSANLWKCYASGRRHVQGLLATLNLRARQDLLSLLWYVVSPREDTVTFEAYMAEGSMPNVVLAVGTPRAVRRIAGEGTDLARLTRKIQAPRDAFPSWPADKLTIQAEHVTIFSDLFGEPRVQATLNPTANPGFKYFRSLYVSDECAEGSHRRVLRATFALPPAAHMGDLSPLVALVPLMIDLVGSYKLPPELKKKAEAARSRVDAEDSVEGRKARMEALAARKAEKLAEEKARIARLPPAERQAAEEKLQKKLAQKQLRKRMKFG